MIYILMKESVATTQSGRHDMGSAQPHAAALTEEAILAKVEKIRQANTKYELESAGRNRWYLGPDRNEDQGFFGDSGYLFWIVEMEPV